MQRQPLDGEIWTANSHSYEQCNRDEFSLTSGNGNGRIHQHGGVPQLVRGTGSYPVRRRFESALRYQIPSPLPAGFFACAYFSFTSNFTGFQSG